MATLDGREAVRLGSPTRVLACGVWRSRIGADMVCRTSVTGRRTRVFLLASRRNLAGSAATATATTSTVWWPRRLAAGLALATALSISVRAHHRVAVAGLEHQGIGLSAWQHGEDGQRYRLANSWSVVFVPSNVPAISLPLRSARPGTDLSVSLLLNGRPANAVRVPSDRWLDVHLVLPSGPGAPDSPAWNSTRATRSLRMRPC